MIEVVDECLEMGLCKRKESTFTLEFNKVLTKFHRKGLEMLMKLAGPEKCIQFSTNQFGTTCLLLEIKLQYSTRVIANSKEVVKNPRIEPTCDFGTVQDLISIGIDKLKCESKAVLGTVSQQVLAG